MVTVIQPHTFFFPSFASISLAFYLVYFTLFLHECPHHRSQSPLKQTSVGSLSNSTALLHHNRPPAVIVDMLPASTLRIEEVQSNRASLVSFSKISSPPRMKEASARGAFSSFLLLSVGKGSYYQWAQVREHFTKQ